MTRILVCDTCKYPDGEKLKGGRTGGEAFFAAVAPLAAAAGIPAARFSCLMNCNSPCSAAVQAAGKIAYVFGRFDPADPGAPAALVDYAARHRESETGIVPFRQWPQGVKGKFVSRTPPPPLERS